MAYRALGSIILVCVFLPGVGHAQHKHVHVGGGFGYGPRIAPAWGYPFLDGGPYVGYPPPLGYPTHFGYPGYYGPGYFGYSGRAGSSWSNGLSLYGPPVPVYGPVPGVIGNQDLVKQWRTTVAPGFAGYGWVGIYAASPRPRHPNVSVWPVVESFGVQPGVHTPGSPVPGSPAPGSPSPPDMPVPVKPGGCLILSVKVPQPAAEVLVDGVKTAQTGTDRIFESPPLEAGQAYKYTVTARWVERGQVVESSRTVTGTPGEVVRVDFTTAVAGK